MLILPLTSCAPWGTVLSVSDLRVLAHGRRLVTAPSWRLCEDPGRGSLRAQRSLRTLSCEGPVMGVCHPPTRPSGLVGLLPSCVTSRGSDKSLASWQGHGRQQQAGTSQFQRPEGQRFQPAVGLLLYVNSRLQRRTPTAPTHSGSGPGRKGTPRCPRWPQESAGTHKRPERSCIILKTNSRLTLGGDEIAHLHNDGDLHMIKICLSES